MKKRDFQNSAKSAEDQRTSDLLTRLVLAELVIFVVMCLITVIWKDWRTLSVVVAASVLQTVPLWLFRHRYFQTGGMFFVVANIAITTLIAMFGQGIFDVAIVALPIIFVFAGLVLNRTLFRLCIGIGLAAVCWLVVGEDKGWIIPQPLPPDPLHLLYLAGLVTLLLVAAFAVDLLATNLQKSLTQSRQEVERREKVEAELRLSEEKYRFIVEKTQDVLFTFNGAGEFLYISPSVKASLGYDPADLIGKTFMSLVHEDDRPSLQKAIQLNLKNGAQTPGGNQYRVYHAHGEWRWHSAAGNAVFDKNGDFLYFAAISRDISEHKRAEKDLKASEQNFRNSIDSSLMGIRIVDEKGRTLYTNQAFLDVFSYENNDELTKSPPEERYTPESYADWVLRYEHLLRGELIPDKVEVDIISKDGTIRHLKVFRKEVLWGGKTQYQTLYDDITERKNAEKALMASEANFRNSMDNSPMGIRIGNAEEQAFYVNSAFMDIFGYKNIEEVKTIPRYERYTPESYAYFCLMKEQEASGESIPDDVEADIVHEDGTIRHIKASRREVFWNGERHVQVIYNDITEHKEAEKKLEQAAQEWRTTFDSITDLISIHDKSNRIIRVNHAVADLLKTTPQELIGKFCHEVMRGDQECPANCPHLLALKTGKSSSLEIYNSKLGIHFQESASPIFNEKGEVTGTVLVARDVTKQKRMEEQLIMTDRLASIGELSSGIAHELNNPLTSVIGFSQLLMEGDAPEDIKKDLSIVYSEAQRAAVIVKNLLTFARKHAPVKQLSQVNTVIEDVLRLRAYEQKVNNIQIETHLASNLPEIMMDHFQIQQVFLNIIVNAEFAMLEAHKRGKLTITTKKYDSFIKITITDDGPGIAKENLKHIFDPFFTTKEVGKGTGLGLSICHGIVTEHGGQIYARSEEGQGASFVVELPLIKEL